MGVRSVRLSDAARRPTRSPDSDRGTCFAGRTEQEIVSGDPKTKATEFLNAFIDEQRSDELAMYARSGLKQKFERGLVNGPPPLGYQRRYGGPGDPERGQLEAVPRGKATVIAIKELYLSGRYSYADVCMKLNPMRDGEGRPLIGPVAASLSRLRSSATF